MFTGNDLDPFNCNSVLAKAASPYLFPFVLEYSLVAMATATVMYDNVRSDGFQVVIKNIHHLIGDNTLSVTETENKDNIDEKDPCPPQSSKHHHHSLLQKSHTGTFLGVIVMIVVFFSLIIFFSSPDSNVDHIVYLSTDIGVHVALIIAAILVMVKIRQMGFCKKPFSIDDLLILISMSGSLLFEFTIILSVMNRMHDDSMVFDTEVVALTLTSSFIALIQTITQVVCILVGLRTMPACKKQAQEMQGRGTIAFMVLVNVSAWILRSLRSKELTLGTMTYLYPDGLWTIGTCIFLPLLLFFHFYSSVCLADIWDRAYRPLHGKCPPPSTTATKKNPVTHL